MAAEQCRPDCCSRQCMSFSQANVLSVDRRRARIEVTGIVQGVGFRPFVYSLASKLGLSGFVANTPEGVAIEVEGPENVLATFGHDLESQAPPLALIRNLDTNQIEPCGDTAFRIESSRPAGEVAAFISPDVAVCTDCLRELFDPDDRRYLYPFINCTNCGPRYTIITDIPYDRPNTAMRGFIMCPQCQAEYDDPADRRFHAQPNACPVCGPHLALHDAQGRLLAERQAAIELGVARLRQGNIIAVKGLGGFHLAIDAGNNNAVLRLRQRKGREEKPFAVMVADLAAARRLCMLNDDEERLLTSPRSPIVLANKKKGNKLAVSVAPGNDRFGVMLAYTPLHHLLLRAVDGPLVMTSGNLSEEPICLANAEALHRLGSLADYFLLHDRDIFTRSDDSVAIHVGGEDRMLRRSRGYAPQPFAIHGDGVPVLAVGGELKNTICLLKGREAVLSQHIGDVTNLAAYEFFVATVEHLQRLYRVIPELVVHDLHPDYRTTCWAREQQDLSTLAVQHHHAHLAACLAENLHDSPAIGLIMDGTGYGTDGTIWGGEVLIGDYRSVERFGCFEPMPLPGNDLAVREPWRTAAGYLLSTFDGSLPDIPFLQTVNAGPIVVQLERGINCPMTSSCGRLFDAVAAMSGGLRRISYEAQASIEFMQAAGREIADPFEYGFDERDGKVIMSVRSIIRSVTAALRKGTSLEKMSQRFHATLIAVLLDLAERARSATHINTVALSGGVFQNQLLFERLLTKLAAEGFQVLTHKATPVNDGCLALGQAMVGRKFLA